MRMRAFTLLEMLVILAVLGVVAAMSLPDLTPVVRRTELRGAVGDTAAMLERARREARTSGRCLQVRVETGALVLERSGTPRCTAFTVLERMRPVPGITVALEAATGAAAFTGGGRLLGDGDLDLEDDGARVSLRSSHFPNQVSYVGITAAGLVCSRVTSVLPAFDASRVCFEDVLVGASSTEPGTVSLGDGDSVAPVIVAVVVENSAQAVGAPPPVSPPPEPEPEATPEPTPAPVVEPLPAPVSPVLPGVGTCFTHDTLVTTSAGRKAIGDVMVGDEVMAFHEGDGATAAFRVAHVFAHASNHLLMLRVGDEVIETTDEHPFWVEGRGFVKANTIAIGDRLRGLSGGVLLVDAIERQQGSFPVYNIEVSGAHTYFVGRHGILVHNKPATESGTGSEG